MRSGQKKFWSKSINHFRASTHFAAYQLARAEVLNSLRTIALVVVPTRRQLRNAMEFTETMKRKFLPNYNPFKFKRYTAGQLA